MEEETKLRIKTAMIVYALETELGNYVIDNQILDNISETTKNTIVEREISRGRELVDSGVSFLVESSYIDEIFNMAIDTTKDTSLNKHFIELKTLSTSLGIFDIRNAVSHPNRSFPDAFWYRAATIASDPLILKLGLSGVRHALNSAESENLNIPPDEWFNNVKWAIPNTLPISFDHEITGLLGREKEFKTLESTLSKVRNNLIAVVAPGGIGKTALILQFLKELSLSPNWSKEIDAIVFSTLKNEQLTADGIEFLEAIDGIEQIKDAIYENLVRLFPDFAFETFEECCIKLANKKILLCIDNLETLLVNSQKEFIDFNQSLPLHWRVIVTSRISLDSATTVPLEPLVKRHAVSLGRNYIKKRGVIEFKQEDLETIAEKANYNPLAIRLTIDLYLKGVDIPASIQKSQKDIASFSYKNLIESLNPNSIEVLEAIYVIGDTTKIQLIELLDLTNEEITESINELSKTSLLIRTTSESGNDKYKLSDSIRDLLLTNPKNIEARTRISESLKERKSKILDQKTRNEQLGLNEFDEDFVSENTDPSIHSLVVDLNKILGQKNKSVVANLSHIKSRFTDLITYNPSNSELLYHYSRVLKGLKDYASEKRILEQANTLTKDKPRIRLALAMNYFYQNSYEDALSIFNDLFSKGFASVNNSSRKFAFTVCKLHMLCYLNLGQYEEILKLTENWQDDQDWSVMKGTYRASAIKRSVELIKHDTVNVQVAFDKALDIFNNIFENENYPGFACFESNKLLKEISFTLRFSEFTNEFKLKLLEFVAHHYFEIINTLKDTTLESSDVKIMLETFFNLVISSKENPLKKAKWYNVSPEKRYDEEHIQELIEEGYTMVEVYYIPEKGSGMPNYIFAQDDSKNQFFLYVDYFEGGWNKWGYIALNSKLGIKFDEINRNGKPSMAKEIVEIDQYTI
jgi:hypothetical protein